MVSKILRTVFLLQSLYFATANSVFDQQLYADVLDPEMCQQQLILLLNHTLRYQFLDASFRIPSGLMTGNLNDLGDYHQCLRIDQTVEDMQIQGKYCTVTVPLNQDPIDWPSIIDWNITIPDLNITLPNITWPELPGTDTEEDQSELMLQRKLLNLRSWAQELAGVREENKSLGTRVIPMMITATRGMTLAVCIPRVCSATQALNFLQQLTGVLNVQFNEYYCRLPNDKPFTTVDYLAIAIFSFIGLLIGMSTAYDLVQVFYHEKAFSSNKDDTKTLLLLIEWVVRGAIACVASAMASFLADSSEISILYRSFSLYTNTRRLLTFKSSPGALECVDGIRTISMLWVIVGHTYSFTLLAFIHNMLDIYEWMTDFSSTWVNAAPITVDTFFMLSGVLVVYTTIGKITRDRFIRNLHLFYLNRFLRMFPLLAAVVLFQSSLINHVADGPFWQNVALSAENCRTYWWAALIHVQNYVNPTKMCIQQTWYLSVDMQLYYIAPLALWWLWGRSIGAWCALTGALLVSLVASTTYSFMYNFSAALANFSRLQEFNDYFTKYYLNTLTRASPFFVGMIYGYMLTIYRDKKIRISRVHAITLWILSFIMMAFCIFSIYPVMQTDHSTQIFDNFLNAYMRAIWAAALGWVIFACVKGYGGPINWFLSLPMWKLPARLSYAMYLIHVSIMLINSGTWVKTHYFTPVEAFYRFVSDVTLAFAAAFVLCVCIDAPCSTLQKLLFGGNKRRPQKPKPETRIRNVTLGNDTYIKTVL